MQDFGLNLIAVLFLFVFIVLLVWLLFKVGGIIRMIKAERNEKVNSTWSQEQLANFTDDELKELMKQLKLDQ